MDQNRILAQCDKYLDICIIFGTNICSLFVSCLCRFLVGWVSILQVASYWSVFWSPHRTHCKSYSSCAVKSSNPVIVDSIQHFLKDQQVATSCIVLRRLFDARRITLLPFLRCASQSAPKTLSDRRHQASPLHFPQNQLQMKGGSAVGRLVFTRCKAEQGPLVGVYFAPLPFATPCLSVRYCFSCH